MRNRLLWVVVATIAVIVFAAEEPNFATWDKFLGGRGLLPILLAQADQ